jgi:hypothetical protein
MIDKVDLLSKLNKKTFYQTYVESLKSDNGSAQGMGLCPFHDDNKPSFSVNYTDGVFNCFACGENGDIFDFYQKLRDVDFKTALREIGKMNGGIKANASPRVVAKFEYTDIDGQVLYVKERYEPARDGGKKEFFFKHQKNGKYAMGRGCKPVLYNLNEIVNAEVVFFVEGEGKVGLLREWGIAATSLDSGANSPWQDEYREIVEGKKHLVIIADNDEPGKAYAERIALELYGKVDSIKIIELSGLEEKGDIIDWAKVPGNDVEGLNNIIDITPVFDGRSRVKSKDDKTPNIITLLEKTVHDRSISPAQDFKNEVMYYAVKIDTKPYLVTSEKEIISFECAEEKGINLNTKFVDTFRFSPEWILAYYNEGKKISVSSVYNKIYDFIKSYIFFTSDAHGKFLTVWVIGTYIFKVFRYYPYVWLNAPKQSGKTLLMEILKEFSFNGDLSSNASESAIFRDVHNNLITMFFDEVEKLSKQDVEKYGAIMSILNTGFSASGFVKRAGSQKHNFAIQRFSTYSPKIFAGIKEIDDVVQDRTIKINMLRKKPGEVAKRYKISDVLIRAQKEIRNELYIFGLQYAKEISNVYNNHFEQIEGLAHLENRELDIWEPIFTIASVIDKENGNTDLADSLSQLSKDSCGERLEDNKDLNETVMLLTTLREMVESDNPVPYKVGKINKYETGEVFEYFTETDEYAWLADYKKTTLTRLLKKNASIKSDLVWSPRIKKKVRMYLIDTESLRDLFERYA